MANVNEFDVSKLLLKHASTKDVRSIVSILDCLKQNGFVYHDDSGVDRTLKAIAIVFNFFNNEYKYLSITPYVDLSCQFLPVLTVSFDERLCTQWGSESTLVIQSTDIERSIKEGHLTIDSSGVHRGAIVYDWKLVNAQSIVIIVRVEDVFEMLEPTLMLYCAKESRHSA